MATKVKVAVLVGSLRKESFNRKLAMAMIAMGSTRSSSRSSSTASCRRTIRTTRRIPRRAIVEFKQRIAAADAVLFVTPEYNRSMPGALKNAIDAASRPYGKSAWDGKPGAVISVSLGALGRSAQITTCGNRWSFSTFR